MIERSKAAQEMTNADVHGLSKSRMKITLTADHENGFDRIIDIKRKRSGETLGRLLNSGAWVSLIRVYWTS